MKLLLVLLESDPWREMLDRLRGMGVGAERDGLCLLLAAGILLVGWGLAWVVGRLVLALLRALRFNQGVRSLMGLAGTPGEHEPAALASWGAYWVVMAGAIILALDTFGFQLGASVEDRMREVLPRVVAAALLLIAGVVGSMLLGALARRLFEGAGIRGARLRGQVVTAVFTVFAVLVALEQLGFAAQFIMAAGIIVFSSAGLALGLAFGLGCRDLARDFVVEYLRSLDDEGPRRPNG